MFPTPKLDLSLQSMSLPALQGHKTAVNARAGGQVSLPWPVGLALGWESKDYAAERRGPASRDTFPGAAQGRPVVSPRTEVPVFARDPGKHRDSLPAIPTNNLPLRMIL